MRRYAADDVPFWIIKEFDRIDYNKVNGTMVEHVCSELMLYARVTFLSFKKAILQTKFIDCDIPQQILDTISQVDFSKINPQKAESIHKSLSQLITTKYGGVLKK